MLTAPQRHNGGPPIIDDEDGQIRMLFARVHISDLLNGIRTLSMEERGFYMTALFLMYDRMGTLPADDRHAAMMIGCEIRTYKRLKARMVALGKFYDTGEGLSNRRVEAEITAYCSEFKARRDAALKRENERRKARAKSDAESQGAIPVVGEIGPTLPGSSAEVGPKLPGSSTEVSLTLPGSSAEVAPQVSENVNEINETSTTSEPERLVNLCSYARASTKPKPKPYSRSEEIDTRPSTAVVAATPPCVPVFDLEPVDVPRQPSRASANGLSATELDALTAFEAYNDLALRIGLPLARSFTPARRRSLQARLREHGMDGWGEVLANVERSSFLRGMGAGRNGFRADLDFLLQAKSCAKARDGGYGNGAHGLPADARPETDTERMMRRAAEVRAEMTAKGVLR